MFLRFLGKVLNCSFDYRKCFNHAFDLEKDREVQFFSEYSRRKPFGWPSYRLAAKAYLNTKELICNSKSLKEYLSHEPMQLEKIEIKKEIANVYR